MKKYVLLALCGLLTVAGGPVSAQNGVTFLEDEAESGGFDLSGKIASLPCEIWVARQENKDGYKFTVRPTGLDLTLTSAGKSRVLASNTLSSSANVPVVIQRRGARFAVYLGSRLALQAEDDSFDEGTIGFRGRLQEARVQPVEPIQFKDDFMRVAAEVALQAATSNPRRGVKISQAQFTEDIWRVVKGKWQTTGLAENAEAQVAQSANPFAFKTSAAGPGVALTGRNFWSDYTASISVQPTGTRALGLLVYAQDAENYLGLVWTSTGGPQLRSVVNGKTTVLDSDPELGGFEDKQWYRLKVSAVNGMLRGYVDDEELLRARSTLFGRGAVGVYADVVGAENGCTFDDAEVISDDTIIEEFAAPVPGRWKNISGTWKFGTGAQPNGTTGAFAVMGKATWQDYATSAQLQVPTDASVGLVTHHKSGQGAYLMRLTGSAARLPYAGKLQLLKIAGSKTQVLAELPVGSRYNGSNHKWTLSTERGYIRAAVNGKRVLDAFDTSLTEGRAGIYGQRVDRGAPTINSFVVEFPSPIGRWAVVPDLYEVEQQAQTMGGWSTPEGLWVPVNNAATEKVLAHKGAFWGDDTLRLPLPDLSSGKTAQLRFKPSANRNLTLTLAVTDRLKVVLSDGTKSWNGSYPRVKEMTGLPLEVSRRGSYVIVRAGKEENQKVVLAASVG